MSEIQKNNIQVFQSGKVYKIETEFFDACGKTEKGGRSENQDAIWFGETDYGLLLIVCDGMGGGPGGRTASTLAVQEIGNYVNKHSNLKPRDVVIGAILSANKSIYSFAKQHAELMGMGSTCVVVLLTKENAVVGHIGDSRYYQLRKHKQIFHTVDHSQVFELVKTGVMTEEEARVSSYSNVITKALGLSMDLKIEIKPDTSSDLLEIPYRKGDIFVLCTDGIHGVVSNQFLVKQLTASDNVEAIVNDVHSMINNLGVNSGNQHDNLTLLMAVSKADSTIPESQRPLLFTPPTRKSPIRKYIKIACIVFAIVFISLLAFLKNERIGNNVNNDSLKIDSNKIDSTKVDTVKKPKQTHDNKFQTKTNSGDTDFGDLDKYKTQGKTIENSNTAIDPPKQKKANEKENMPPKSAIQELPKVEEKGQKTKDNNKKIVDPLIPPL